MWDKVINLTTPEGRAVYRLINVLVPQSVTGFLVYFVDEIQGIPADTDIQVIGSVIVGGLVTSYMKYRRDNSVGVEGSGDVRSGDSGGMHYTPPR